MADLLALRSRALEDLEDANDAAALDQWRIAYLGRQGEVTQILGGLGQLPPEERPVVGSTAATRPNGQADRFRRPQRILRRCGREG